MKKKNVFKIIGIILLVLFILLLIHTLRNYTIIRNLQKKFSTYSSSNNYRITSVAQENENTIVTMDFYKKDDKQVVFIERNKDGEVIKQSMYDNGERVDIFVDNGKEKICNLDLDTSIIQVNLVNYLEFENDWQTFLGSIFARITRDTHNNKECYVINNLGSPVFMYDSEKNEVYLEKDTGLYVKSTFGDQVSERTYEFNNIEDSIFTEPDISKYKIQK